jgi:glyoxylase-like metal-dependent hydrolase (beta-lactamase superfamily II)
MRIAERWFERRRMSDDITLLWEPHVHPLLRCNIWHVRGRDHDLLIDTGLGLASLGAAIADLIDKPLIAVATHIHYDHVGSLHEFEVRVMHAIEAPRMANYREFAALDSAAFPPDFLGGFAHPDFDRYLINAIPAKGFTIDEYAVRSTQPTRTVIDGDVVDLGDRHFEVLHLPGHSPGSLGLYEATSATLFSGDAIYDGVLLDELPDSSIADYIATMRRLRALRVRVVHGGHEPSFGRARLLELIDAYLAMRA